MVIKRGEWKLKPRQMGVALQNIEADKFGTALFEKEVGSEQYFEFEVKAIEYIRENHEVWVVDNNNGVTEHTPQELRSETAAGVPYRVTDVAPLPVTMGSKGKTHVTITVTTSANATIIAPSGTTKKIRVHWYSYSNGHTAKARIGMRFGDSGDIKHRHTLAPDGGNINANLVDANFEGAAGETLYAKADADYSGGVDVNVCYSEVE